MADYPQWIKVGEPVQHAGLGQIVPETFRALIDKINALEAKLDEMGDIIKEMRAPVEKQAKKLDKSVGSIKDTYTVPVEKKKGT